AGGVGPVNLLDTGVWSGHDCFLASEGGPLERLLDCDGITPCSGVASQTDAAGAHGTCTPPILAGNAPPPPDPGPTRARIESYKIYDSAGLNADAAAMAFDDAMTNGNALIVGELTADCGSCGPTAVHANTSYLWYHVAVIAANGDRMPDPTRASCS